MIIMDRNHERFLNQILEIYYNNPIFNQGINTINYPELLDPKMLKYLEAKGLLNIKWDYSLNAWIEITSKGITYFNDKKEKRFDLLIKSGLLPIIVSIVTNFALNFLIPK